MADEQASTDIRNARIARGAEISDWMMVNAAKQKFDFESAVLADRFPKGQFGTLPWGNTTFINQAPVMTPESSGLATSAAPAATSLLSKVLPLAAAAALGATGAGGVMAIPAIASLFSQQPQQPAATQPGVIEFPVQIDWNFDPNGGTVKPKQ